MKSEYTIIRVYLCHERVEELPLLLLCLVVTEESDLLNKVHVELIHLVNNLIVDDLKVLILALKVLIVLVDGILNDGLDELILLQLEISDALLYLYDLSL
jgi:hypothetical protein